MTDPGKSASDFLERAGWPLAKIKPLAGDMSSRRYFRVIDGEKTAVLMVASADMSGFVQMTRWLEKSNLSVPEVYYDDAKNGLLLLEDFGDQTLKALLNDEPRLADDVFGDCVSLLLRIRESKVAKLSSPEAAELVEWTHLADAYYPGLRSEGLASFRKTLLTMLHSTLAGPRTTSLRDFHTQNMMWLPMRSGIQRIGLLDYQDSFLTHPSYDLMSLLTDARTKISCERRNSVIDQYLSQTGDERGAFKAAFAALSAQRNLRILGVFARAGRQGDQMENAYRYFVDALNHPAFDAVRQEVLESIPSPEADA